MSERVAEIEAATPRPRWVYVAVAICVIGAIGTLASVGAFVYSRSGSATSHDLRAIAVEAQVVSARADCRSEYSARMTEAVRARDALVAEGLVALTRGDTARLGVLSVEVEAANRAVKDLPRLDAAVDEGFALGGTRYPPCPG